MSLNPGTLRHRVSLQKQQALTDSNGDPLQLADGSMPMEWVEVAAVWAAVEPISAREFIQSAATQAQVTTRIVIRYRSDIDASWRVVHNGKIYNVAGVLADKDSGLEYLTLPCSQGVDQGT